MNNFKKLIKLKTTKNLIYFVIIVFISSCSVINNISKSSKNTNKENNQSNQFEAKNEGFKYLTEQFADLKLIRYQVPGFEELDCLIIDNYKKNIDEKLFYSILNQSKQLDSYVVINSILPIKDIKFELEDLKSRAGSFVNLGIELPTDDLLRVIISKSFSDKQIEITPKISEYIIKNIERSYEKVFKFIKEIDDLSLSSGKSININLIKKVLNNE